MTEAREFRTINAWLDTFAGTLQDSEPGIVWLVDIPAAPALVRDMPGQFNYVVITPCCDQARIWRDAGFQAFPDCDSAFEHSGAPQAIVLRTEKQSAAAQAMLASACRFLSSHGQIMAYAPNNAGGRQLPKYATMLGLAYSKYAKHHCTFITARLDQGDADDQAMQCMITAGDYQLNENGYYACPGLHSWQHIDTGSAMLATYLPGHLPGNGADFGCGWGYLSCEIIPKMDDQSHLYCLDNDKRALKAAAMNIETFAGEAELNWQTLWRDVRTPHDMPDNLDWIVMNPPFHNGREEDITLGRAFITRAASCLRKGGRLYMVANRKLAYEDDLNRHFSAVEKMIEDNGYKIVKARK